MVLNKFKTLLLSVVVVSLGMSGVQAREIEPVLPESLPINTMDQPRILDFKHRLGISIPVSLIPMIGAGVLGFVLSGKKPGPALGAAAGTFVVSVPLLYWILKSWGPESRLEDVKEMIEDILAHPLMTKVELSSEEEADQGLKDFKVVQAVKEAYPFGMFNNIEIQKAFEVLYKQVAFLSVLIVRLSKTRDMDSKSSQKELLKLRDQLKDTLFELGYRNRLMRAENTNFLEEVMADSRAKEVEYNAPRGWMGKKLADIELENK